MRNNAQERVSPPHASRQEALNHFGAAIAMPHVLNASRNGIISRSCGRTQVRTIVGTRNCDAHRERAGQRLDAAKAALRGVIRHDELSPHCVQRGDATQGRRCAGTWQVDESRGWSESSLVTQSIPAAGWSESSLVTQSIPAAPSHA